MKCVFLNKRKMDEQLLKEEIVNEWTQDPDVYRTHFKYVMEMLVYWELDDVVEFVKHVDKFTELFIELSEIDSHIKLDNDLDIPEWGK